MPHINRIRVNNVRYNFGTQSYEDFCLKPFGHNMLYDLANGGGKSVLMLLMLQTVLPNCSLDDKQPVEKLFRTGDGSQTIHSLVEWKLDAADVVNGFRYMTTGFCARKAQNSEEDKSGTASIDYFNYCIFYRDYNANDICNLPLVKNKEKITYTGLRKYLKELERDNSLVVKLFDTKREYQGFLADYGIYESEWEIIRGINRTEGHVRTYFETNYRTTRKVVEELLIEEIIQKSFALRGGQDAEEAMSRTLLEMKDKLVELSKKKAEIGNYDRQMELLAMFAQRTETLKAVYARMESLRGEISGLHRKTAWMERISGNRQEECGQELSGIKDAAWKLQERIDAAHYLGDCSQEKRLEVKKKQLGELVNAHEDALRQTEQAIIWKESENDYLEYQEERAKRDELSAEIAAMSSEKGTLLSEVRFLAHHMKKELARTQQQLSGEHSALEARYHSLKIQLQQLRERGNELARKAAGEEVRAQQLRERLEYLDNSMNTKKRQVGILVLEECGNKKEEYEAEYARLSKEQGSYSETLSQVAKELEETKRELLACELRLEQLGGEEVLQASFLAAYEEEKQRADRLLLVYGARDYGKLAGRIREKEVSARVKEEELSGRIRCRRERIKRLTDGGWGAVLEELPGAEEWKEYIRVRHGIHAQTGREYLAGIKEDLRGELLKQYPYLPYTLVVEDGLDELWQDEKLHQGEQALVFPVVKAAALRNQREVLSEGDILIFSKKFENLEEDAAAEKELGELSAAVREDERRMRTLEDQRETYRADEKSLWQFLNCYEEKYREYKERAAKREQTLAAGQAQRAGLLEKQKELSAQGELCRTKVKKAGERMEELAAETEVLKQLKQEFDEMQGIIPRLREIDSAAAKLSGQQQELAEKCCRMEREAAETFEHANAVRMKSEQLTMRWKEKYERYDVPGEYGECTLSGEALRAELSGKCQAYERGHSEEDDKNRLMQSYVSAMNRCLRAIEGRGVPVAKLREKEARGGLYMTAEQELKKLRGEREKQAQVLAEKQRELAQTTAEWNRLHGKTGQLAAELTKRYGGTPALQLAEEEIGEYVQNSRAKLEMLRQQESQLKEKQDALAQETLALCDMRKDIERMMHGEGIHPLRQDGGDAPEEKAESLRQRFRNTEGEYARAAAEQKKCQEEFAHNLQKVTETLVLLNAASLADEMRESVVLPGNEQDTELLVKNLHEVRDCLALEKGRIESGIEDIVGLKENFEDQCLQRCINIKTELDRLPALSKITLSGEPIPIVSLQIPYVKEEFYRERMSVYLDELVENVEDFKEPADRLRFIRNALSFKKLFAVIVKDMNAIRLSLYKRERMKEQSRHLRYEEAVGSTGQSQGIYIQFLIAVINYIANINSGRGDDTDLGKVIFIDNPFGAAKDIYIWEPIFELLRTNKVQLIVPARGTTPAITGRFDVNYILGQKLVDGKQQTVVVDYHSSVKTEELEYIPLQFEQESFDFL